MDTRSIQTIARRGADVLSRRASLGGFAGATLAAAVPLTLQESTAKKSKKKTCRKQIGACQAAVAAFCARTTQSEPEPCGVALLPCRAAFKGCKAGDFYACLTDALLVLAKSPPT